MDILTTRVAILSKKPEFGGDEYKKWVEQDDLVQFLQTVPSLDEMVLYPGDTIWLYGDSDPFYPLSHSQGNFTVFQAAGGKGAFHAFPPPESSGHRIVAYPNVWASLVEAYLKRQGLPTGER